MKQTKDQVDRVSYDLGIAIGHAQALKQVLEIINNMPKELCGWFGLHNGMCDRISKGKLIAELEKLK